MPARWKLLGLAGVAGVAATGAVVAKRRRDARPDIDPDELRARLHDRLATVESLPEQQPSREELP